VQNAGPHGLGWTRAGRGQAERRDRTACATPGRSRPRGARLTPPVLTSPAPERDGGERGKSSALGFRFGTWNELPRAKAEGGDGKAVAQVAFGTRLAAVVWLPRSRASWLLAPYRDNLRAPGAEASDVFARAFTPPGFRLPLRAGGSRRTTARRAAGERLQNSSFGSRRLRLTASEVGVPPWEFAGARRQSHPSRAGTRPPEVPAVCGPALAAPTYLGRKSDPRAARAAASEPDPAPRAGDDPPETALRHPACRRLRAATQCDRLVFPRT